jgi:hypothetical protein
MGAITNWEAPIYLELMTEYDTNLNTLNVGMAVMLLLLGVGNLFTTPLANSMISRNIWRRSPLTAAQSSAVDSSISQP